MTIQKSTGLRVVFRFAVYITHPIDLGDQTVDDLTSQANQRAIEKELFRDLAKAGYVEADCELLDYEVHDVNENPRERGDDDGIEYADPRDALAERLED